MEQVEVVMTGYSIVVAMCFARLLDGLRPALRLPARYWPHFLWIVNKIINVLVIYWATWYFIDPAMNFAQFILVLTAPAIVYLQCDALLSKNPDTVEDWSVHFFANRRYFFIANFLLGIALFSQTQWASVGGYPVAVYVLLGFLSAVSLLGFWSSNERVHQVIAVIAFVNLTVGFAAQLSLAT